MKRLTLFRKTLRDVRGMLIGVAIAVGAIAFADVLVFPSYSESLRDMELPDLLEGFLGEATGIGTPEGFLTTEFFSWAPIIVIILAIAGGTYAFAGEEANGTLELIAAQPIKRWRIALEKSAALAVAVTLASLASVAGYAAGTIWVEIGVSVPRFTVATLNMVPVALLFLGVALLLSAVLPNRGPSAIAVIGLVVVTYFIQILAISVPAIEPLRVLSPFYWAEPSRVLLHGFDWLRSGVMLGIAAALIGLTVWAVERREIAQGAREWNRPALRWLPWRNHAGVTDDDAGDRRRPVIIHAAG